MLGVLLTGSVLAMAAAGHDACGERANNDFERLYCQVVGAGLGSGLPAMEDFQRNEPAMQALLLQRPAQRLGLDMPPLPDSDTGPADAVVVTPAVIPELTPDEAVEVPQGVVSEPFEADLSLGDCRFRGNVIDCPRGRFQLIGNQPNQSLAPGALDEDWQMDLPRFRGDPDDQAAVHSHLSGAYDVYIHKMLSIGLAGNTMSFTEFVHGFRRHQAHGIDYTRRMEATFQLLKQDKKTHVIPEHFHDRLPESLDACMEAGADIIVCDNVHTNWVYRRQ
ncbi:MAG: hypothetical protein EA349_05815 [Halomonadaceae bacterium]|nr:MAG: hypothetical protein EA349_05815 [Halomonadaceae bacterium]